MKALIICVAVFGLLACESCKDCYLIENEGEENEQELDLGEKCGDELESLDGTTFTAPNGSATRSYCN